MLGFLTTLQANNMLWLQGTGNKSYNLMSNCLGNPPDPFYLLWQVLWAGKNSKSLSCMLLSKLLNKHQLKPCCNGPFYCYIYCKEILNVLGLSMLMYFTVLHRCCEHLHYLYLDSCCIRHCYFCCTNYALCMLLTAVCSNLLTRLSASLMYIQLRVACVSQQ